MRKLIFALAAVALVSTSCSSGPKTLTMKSLADETDQIYQLLIPPGADILPGTNRVIFGVFDNQGEFVADLDLSVYYGPSDSAAPTGPVEAVFRSEGLADKPFYSAQMDLLSIGDWPVVIVENVESGTERKRGALSMVTVKESSTVPQVGDLAPDVRTPTIDDHLDVPDICTREPEGPMHDISLDVALKNHKPTVVVLGSPAFCSSRLCGPVVEQVLAVRGKVGAEAANFIHIEVYIDVNENKFLPSFEAWTLNSEPWVFVMDSDGVIKARFEGPVTPKEILEPLEALI